jgi:hypothetical protein
MTQGQVLLYYDHDIVASSKSMGEVSITAMIEDFIEWLFKNSHDSSTSGPGCITITNGIISSEYGSKIHCLMSHS